MNLFIEFVVTIFLVIKAIIKSVVYTFVSAKPKSVQGEVVLITGAGSGLGRLMCDEFAKRGARVVAWDVNQTGNEETGTLIKQRGGDIVTYTCDISDRDAVYKAAEAVRRDVGHVDILVNNAGIVSGKNFLDIPDSLIEKTVEVNLLAHFWTVKCFLPHMMAHNHGHIVTIASSAGIFGCNGLTDYCASKFGNVGFAETLDYEISAAKCTGVHSTIVCPYFINTGMFDGCQTRFPRILPVLQPKETVRKIMKAVLTNQHMLMIPRTMYLLHFLKVLLPVDAGLPLHTFFGATDFMATFRGRQKQQ